MNIIRTIKKWYQRARYGYAQEDLWNIDYWFLTIIPNMLEDFALSDRWGIPADILMKNIQELREMFPR